MMTRFTSWQKIVSVSVVVVVTATTATTVLFANDDSTPLSTRLVVNAFSFGETSRCFQSRRRLILGGPTTTTTTKAKPFSSRRIIMRTSSRGQLSWLVELLAKKSRSGNDGTDGLGGGMEDAFRQLEELTLLGGLDGLDGDENDQKQKQRKNEAFARAMKELNLQDIIKEEAEEGSAPFSMTASTFESEVELYKDMAEELSLAESEEDIVLDLKNDILSATSDIDQQQAELTNKLMDRAIDEALQEAREQVTDESSASLDKGSFLDNKEIMSEIEKIFDKANAQLLEGIEEIRSEQMSIARESAERKAKETEARMEEEERRLASAEANMKKMLSKVNEETLNVQKAIEDLKRAQLESEQGLDSQLSELKSGGLIKQATLVGSLLFTFRAGVETIGFLAGDVSHAYPALVQGAIAIVCLMCFIFL